MQESINGCDWLWIITTNAGAFYFATQAKKLHYQSLRRRQVNYHRSNKHKPQIKRLMKFAIRISLLSFYSYRHCFSSVWHPILLNRKKR